MSRYLYVQVYHCGDSPRPLVISYFHKRHANIGYILAQKSGYLQTMRSFIKPSRHEAMSTSYKKTLHHSKNGRNTGEWNLTHLHVIAFPLPVSGIPPPIHTHFIIPHSKNCHLISQIFRSHSVGKAIMVRTRNKPSKQSKSCPRNDQKKYKCCSSASQVSSLPDTSASTSGVL